MRGRLIHMHPTRSKPKRSHVIGTLLLIATINDKPAPDPWPPGRRRSRGNIVIRVCHACIYDRLRSFLHGHSRYPPRCNITFFVSDISRGRRERRVVRLHTVAIRTFHCRARCARLARWPCVFLVVVFGSALEEDCALLFLSSRRRCRRPGPIS